MRSDSRSGDAERSTIVALPRRLAPPLSVSRRRGRESRNRDRTGTRTVGSGVEGQGPAVGDRQGTAASRPARRTRRPRSSTRSSRRPAPSRATGRRRRRPPARRAHPALTASTTARESEAPSPSASANPLNGRTSATTGWPELPGAGRGSARRLGSSRSATSTTSRRERRHLARGRAESINGDEFARRARPRPRPGRWVSGR